VDGFQGREKEAIVMSLVRSNKKGQVGFLADFRRMNVAVTRARRHCCVFGNSQTIVSNPFLAKLVTYFEQHAEYRSVMTGDASKALTVTAPVVAVVKALSPPLPKRVDVNAFAREMEALLQAFWESSDRSKLLDVTYNAMQRRLVHESAEDMCQRGQMVYHRSSGSGEERTICVSKDPFPVAEIELVEVLVTASPRPDVDGDVVVVAAAKVAAVAMVESAPVKKKSAKVPKVELKKKKKKKKQPAEDVGPALARLEDDRVLDEAIAERKHGLCHFPGCKVVTSLVMVYTTCRHCANAFCTSHSLPEIHGCGDAAKKFARKEWLAFSPQEAGKVVPMSKAKKELLKNVLHKKLKEAQQSRAPKKTK
jgi:ATP-dependent RNA/DNA helicase IGHMBP2